MSLQKSGDSLVFSKIATGIDLLIIPFILNLQRQFFPGPVSQNASTRFFSLFGQTTINLSKQKT